MARLDVELVRRGLARSRGEARELIAAGHVRVGDAFARKPAQEVVPDVDLQVVGDAPRWVGRAAHKLQTALGAWAPEGLSAAGRRCIDVGASTGGFTQVLLEGGARTVLAVDVGHGQLAPVVAADPRVEDHSGTTVRGLTAEALGGAADLLVADLSFISLTLVMGDLAGLVRSGADLVLLVKPQFEVGRARLSGSGVVTAPRDRRDALRAVLEAARSAGLAPHRLIASPITGSAGNVEYLLWARKGPSDTMALDRVDAAVRALTTTPNPGEG